MSDELLHYLILDGRARCVVAVTTGVVKEAQRRHDLDPMATIALGRSLTCAALLSSSLKSPAEFVQLTFEGPGPLKRISVDFHGDGTGRGYVAVPQLNQVVSSVAEAPDSVEDALGLGGTLKVTRGKLGDKVPYTAITQIENGGIATDIAHYLTVSEQIPSAVAAGVKLDRDASVLGAGGVMVQKMGDSDLSEQELQEFEKKLALDLQVSDRIAAGADVEDLIQFVDDQVKGQSMLGRRILAFQCRCSRDRIAQSLVRLSEADLDSLFETDQSVEAKCEFCAETYHFTRAELQLQ